MKLEDAVQTYVTAVQTQYDKEFALFNALRGFTEDNYLFSLSNDLLDPYSDLIKSLIGDTNFDWLSWWLWETDFGQNPMLFFIDNKEYDPSGMTFMEFWNLVYVKA